MGGQCVWFARDGEPAKLSDSNPDDICESCRRAGLATASASGREELLKAARVLLEEGVPEEFGIKPTIAYAACLGESRAGEQLAWIRDQFNNADEGSEAWQGLLTKFINTFGNLEPRGARKGVLVVGSLVTGTEITCDDAGAVEKVVIEVADRSVKPNRVAREYRKALAEGGASWDQADRGEVSWKVYASGALRIVVRPHVTGIQPIDDFFVPLPGKSPPFPPPQIIEGLYSALYRRSSALYRRSADKEFAGYANYLPGRIKGPAAGAASDGVGLVVACVAGYLRHRVETDDDAERKRLAVEVINTEVLEPLNKETYPKAGSGTTLWNRVENLTESMVRLDGIVRSGAAKIGTKSGTKFEHLYF